MLGAQAAHPLLDPFLPGPVRVPLDHQCSDLVDDRLRAHRRVAAYPGLVTQQLKVIADIGQQSRTADVTVVLTEASGQVEIAVPRDRATTFEPQIVKKRQRRLNGVDEAVLSPLAR